MTFEPRRRYSEGRLAAAKAGPGRTLIARAEGAEAHAGVAAAPGSGRCPEAWA